MAIATYRDAETWIGGYRLTTNMHTVGLGQSVEEVRANVFTDTGPRRLAGMPDHAIAIEGFMDEANSGAAAAAVLGSQDSIFSVAPLGGAGGALTDIAYSGRAQFGALDGALKPGDLYRFSLQGKCSPGERLVRGVLMHNAQRSSTSQTTGVQLGAVTATQYVYGALHVYAFEGTTPTLNVVVSSSATQGGSYTARLTFTQQTGLVAEWKSAAGAITDTWWRIEYTIGGTDTPKFTFAVTVGIQTP